MGLDLKLGVLMEGPYGTGKTLTAFWLGKIATQYGWTFIYLKNCRDAAKALRIAENYARNNNGVILFTEDIDQIIRGKRGQEIQDIVNTLDGGDNKNLPIISIFTTNHIEVIEPTFLRGKRIGSLIPFGVLDMDTAKQFIDKLVVDNTGNSLMEKGDHTPAYEALCGIVPAFASEVIDKAKAYMIHRGSNKINANDIVIAATSYKKQIEYAECRKIEKNDSLNEALQTVGKHLFFGDGKNSNREMLDKLASVYTTIQNNGSK
jgi:transitional endoplasmic reticulum ATPase